MRLVGGRVGTSLLLETPAAVERIGEIVRVGGVEEVHLGLNDLHLAMGLDFMFELLSGGIVANCAEILRAHNIKFGFGGVARLGTGMLPAALILAEHQRLGSTQVILSRDFWAVFEDAHDAADATARLSNEVARIRAHMAGLADAAPEDFARDRADLVAAVDGIVQRIRTARGT